MSTDKITLKIAEILGKQFAVSTDEGEVIFKEIIAGFENSNRVELEFKDLKIIVSTFFNAAVGQLYGKYNSEYLRENLSLHNISQDDLVVLVKVIERAKEYFKDKHRFNKIINPKLPDGESDY